MKALVIEDDPTTRLLLQRLLTRFFPHGVLAAADGEEGLAAVERERPDIVFCDVHMPRLDGVGFLRQLRAHPDFTDLPVIVLTLDQERDTVLALLRLKVVDYILKPVDPVQTVRRLERLLPAVLPQHGEGPTVR